MGFFYFSALNSDDRKLWLEQILLKNRVYFRSREQLDDPNELRPSIAFEGTDKQLRIFVRELLVTRSPVKLSPAKRLVEENKLIHQYRKRPEWVEGILHEILDRIGLFCLSETAEDPLLWAHYADGHRGACVEFDQQSGLFLAAQQVIYTAQAPVINRLVDGANEILEKSLLTKGTAWAYQREWRVIARWKDGRRIAQYLVQHVVPAAIEQFIRGQHGPGYYPIAPEAIRGVILGSRLAPDVEVWLRSVVDRAFRPIAIRRAAIDRNGAVTVV